MSVEIISALEKQEKYSNETIICVNVTFAMHLVYILCFVFIFAICKKLRL